MGTAAHEESPGLLYFIPGDIAKYEVHCFCPRASTCTATGKQDKRMHASRRCAQATVAKHVC